MGIDAQENVQIIVLEGGPDSLVYVLNWLEVLAGNALWNFNPLFGALAWVVKGKMPNFGGFCHGGVKHYGGGTSGWSKSWDKVQIHQ